MCAEPRSCVDGSCTRRFQKNKSLCLKEIYFFHIFNGSLRCTHWTDCKVRVFFFKRACTRLVHPFSFSLGSHMEFGDSANQPLWERCVPADSPSLPAPTIWGCSLNCRVTASNLTCQEPMAPDVNSVGGCWWKWTNRAFSCRGPWQAPGSRPCLWLCTFALSARRWQCLSNFKAGKETKRKLHLNRQLGFDYNYMLLNVLAEEQCCS